ncbi:DUF1700 domain-containing protein [Actinophytocola glycyrrhizae]|uniref:DUF1700 domain-containing protein n=1 Tax=Actinophytocola glycyrrhizae TaxID=2044873 RepID=A0ABV9RYI7_9PSEU
MNTGTDTEVGSYLDRLRHELADLPAAEVEEIVQDVEPQVSATAGELAATQSPATLADRLGDPAEYARELRAAMGVPAEPTGSRTPEWLPRTAFWVLVVATAAAGVGGYAIGQVMTDAPRPVLVFLLVALAASWLTVGRSRSTAAEMATLPEVRLVAARLAEAERRLPVRDHLRSLWPGWLIARAALMCLGMMWLLGWFGWQGAGTVLPAVAVAALTVVVGRRTGTHRQWLWLSLPLDAWAVGVALKAAELLPLLATGDHVW